MYAKRVQIINYGPIGQLDIEFPFDGDFPKQVVLVGQNGSGKSILLSHIINGLASAKDIAFPETPEVEIGKVFKIRSPLYIRTGSDWYFAKVDFEDTLSMGEITSRSLKREYRSTPPDFSAQDAKDAWDQMEDDLNSHIVSNITRSNGTRIRDIFSKNCVLYFPPNRFEEPAWLNEENLNTQAEYMNLKHIQGYSSRKLMSYSPLHDNQKWLFDVAYDRAVFETQTFNFPMPVQGSGQSVPLPIQIGPSGNATNVYGIALQIVQLVMKDDQSARFGIGRRLNRVVSLEGTAGNIVPNIFQLSSGETSILNLFLSILRDFDLSGASLTNAEEIRGVVVVDEIDLHLHAVHQHEILPSLMRMFPKVQFVITTHSPLFVLGMVKTFGEDGFALCRMPQGEQISPEEFTEFEDAYRAFTTTSTFSDDIRAAVKDAQSPILYMEGKTDVQYLKRAADLLGKKSALDAVEIDEREGGGNLKNIWEAVKNLPVSLVPRKAVLFHDCDYDAPDQTKENRFRRTIPYQSEHPIKRGIENLFNRETLQRALGHKPEFIDTTPEHSTTIRGQHRTIPEQWGVNKDEKTNLCDWLCESGSAEDFEHFRVILEILEEVLGSHGDELCNSA